MQYVVELINDGDVCSLGILIVFVLFIGAYTVNGQPKLHDWGQRLAGVAFLAYTAYGWHIFRPEAAADWLGIVFRGLLAAGLGLGISWLVLGVASFGYGLAFAGPAAQTRRVGSSLFQRMSERRKERQEEAARQRQQAEWERARPERERAEGEAAKQRREEADRQTETAKRREDAIAACELLYHLRGADIGERLTREQYREFVTKFMGADKTIEVVERRAGELQQLIQQHYEAACPPSRFTDLAQLTAWYEEQNQQISSLSVTDVYKRDFLVQLNERYAELTQQTLEKL